MNPEKIKKTLIIIPTMALAVMLIQQNYNWIFGMFVGIALALTSCEMIQKAVNNSFVKKMNRNAMFYMIGFFFRFVILGLLLFFAILYFKVNVIVLTISFTLVQLIYPFYLMQSLESRKQNV